MLDQFIVKSSQILYSLRGKDVNYWEKVRRREILKLFHAASKGVPAYKDFLRKNKIKPENIRTIEDFKYVPPVDKNNYLRFYPYEKLLWGGKIRKPLTIHSTSGSTGEPTYFIRDFASDLRREVIVENFFKNNDLTIKGPTLFVITFGMGIWSAGVGIYTGAYLAINLKKLPISIVSPGVNKEEVIKILKKLAPNFKQTIIAGYPPFVKDLVDDALREGINLKTLNLRFIFTGEGFNEDFRNYLTSKAGVKNVFTDTMNTYGTSELGAIAIETPLSVLVTQMASRNRNLFRDLFGDLIKTPTLAQYIPYFVNFECVDGELFFIGDSAIPLIKYRSEDNGGLLTFTQVKEILLNHGFNLEKESKKINIFNYIYQLPLVFVYERKNLTTTLYGILIYPEFIKKALFKRQLSKFLTGKFTMITKYDKKQNQYLEINLELKKGLKFKKYYEKIALQEIVKTLREKSSEFRELSNNLKERAWPKLIFWPYEHPKYFTSGIKQKWVIKSIL
jgi:phenylacetate-CoA ligase